MTTSGTPDHHVILGLGANLGDPLAQLQEAIRQLGEFMTVERTSSVYRTAPVGGIEQPDFLNLVCLGRFEGNARALHAKLVAVENTLGRTRRVRNGPRTIDIDLLTFGELVMRTPELTIPHPRLHERAFVLVPLAEVAPMWRHPTLGASALELLARLDAPERVERVAAPLIVQRGGPR